MITIFGWWDNNWFLSYHSFVLYTYIFKIGPYERSQKNLFARYALKMNEKEIEI